MRLDPETQEPMYTLSELEAQYGKGEKVELLPGEPRYTIQTWVDQIVGRRGKAFDALMPELRTLIIGLIEQLSVYAEHKSIDLRKISFGEIIWTRDGKLVIDITLDGHPVHPEAIRY